MSNKDGKFEVNGVVDSYNRDVYKVSCSFGETKNIIQCTLSGKMRKNSIKVLDGDRVTVEIDQYDTTKGRIVSRERTNQAPRR